MFKEIEKSFLKTLEKIKLKYDSADSLSDFDGTYSKGKIQKELMGEIMYLAAERAEKVMASFEMNEGLFRRIILSVINHEYTESEFGFTEEEKETLKKIHESSMLDEGLMYTIDIISERDDHASNVLQINNKIKERIKKNGTF